MRQRGEQRLLGGPRLGFRLPLGGDVGIGHQNAPIACLARQGPLGPHAETLPVAMHRLRFFHHAALMPELLQELARGTGQFNLQEILKWLAQHLGCAIAKNPLGAAAPELYAAIDVRHADRRMFDQPGLFAQLRVGRFLGRNVARQHEEHLAAGEQMAAGRGLGQKPLPVPAVQQPALARGFAGP